MKKHEVAKKMISYKGKRGKNSLNSVGKNEGEKMMMSKNNIQRA